MAEIEGVVKLLFPEINATPPLEDEYQSITFPADVAEIDRVPVPHLELLVPVGTPGTEFIVAVTLVLVEETQPVAAVLVSA